MPGTTVDRVGLKIRQYHILELIGQGAMGAVYRAHDTTLDRDVAVKFLTTTGSPGLADREKFFREAKAVAGLAHPHIVVVHDVGEHHGACFFVMEYLRGVSLRRRLAQGPRPSWREGLHIASQVCRALQAAHDRSLLHRDIKPDNIWIMPDGHVKVLDFGIAHWTAGPVLTGTNRIPGTPEYMAPEQFLGEKVDGRADLYSLGILIYEMLTGHLPFFGPNPETVIYRQIEEEPTLPGQLAGDLPDIAEKIILKAMAKDPDHRYPSASEMDGEIQALLSLPAGGERIGPEGRELKIPYPPEALGRGESRGPFESRLVGREEEATYLRSAVDGLEKGRGGTVLIGGEAGIGKTRLALEALNYARARGALVLQGACLYAEGPEPYLPFIKALVAGFESRQDGQERLEKFIRQEAPELQGLISRLVTVIRTRHSAGLRELEETIATSRERLFEAITQAMLFFAEEAPVVLLLDDLQWADSGTLQLLHYIARDAAERSLLLVGTYRTEELLPEAEGRPHSLDDTMQRMSREGILNRLELRAMSPSEIHLIVRFLLHRASFSADFKASLYRETGGNPLFVIEVLKMLRDEGAIFERRGIWRERRAITASDIPARVYDVIARRLSRLTEDQRELLQIAAVGGDAIDSEILARIARRERLGILQDLARLERGHQILRSQQGRYRFGHAKIREILYDEIPPELRREYHLAFGRVLETRNSAQKGEHLSELAYHFHRGEAADRALSYLIRAGDRSMRMFAYREARDCYRWALDDLPGLRETDDYHRLKSSLLYRLALALERLGITRQAVSCLEESETIAARIGDQPTLAEVQRRLGSIHCRAGSYDQATECYRRSMETFEKVGDSGSICRVLIGAAAIPFEQGDWQRVRGYYGRALRIARKARDRRQIGLIFMNLGTIASIQGKWNRALALYGKSRKRFVEAEDRANLASLYLNEGWSHAARRSWEKARESYLNALQISRKTHNIFRESECYLNLAEVFLATSNLRESRRSCLKALEIFRKIHNQLGIADAYKTLGQLASVERKWGEARIHFEKSISASEGLRHPLFAGRARMEYARMLKDSGSLSEALGEIQKSIAWFEKVEARDDLNSAAELGRELEALRYLERA